MESGPGVDEVLMEVLRALAMKGRGKRAERIMQPAPVEAAPSEMPMEDESQMQELEEMLSDPDAMAPEEKKEDDEDEME